MPLLGCTSVAFPAIQRRAAIPYEIVATEMAGVLVGVLLDATESCDVELYLMDRFRRMSRDDFFVFFEAFAAQEIRAVRIIRSVQSFAKAAANLSTSDGPKSGG